MSEIVEGLRRYGCARGGLWTRKKIDNVLMHRPAYTGHVAATGLGPMSFNEAINYKDHPTAGFACHTMADTMKCPGFLDFVLPFTDTAAEYFGEEPRLYSINSFWKKPGADEDWHFDHDDRKVMVMFIYGTDIQTDEDGPHSYMEGTHEWSESVKTQFHKCRLEPSAQMSYYGVKGTYFFTNTSGLHKGYAPKVHPRLLTWVRWGVSNPPHAYKEDKLRPVPRSELEITIPVYETLRRATSLVIDWNK